MSAITLDSLSGTYKIYQLTQGHRFSTDDLLVAWYARRWAKSASRILDLGSGLGTVSTILAWVYPKAQIVTVEAQKESVQLARKSASLNQLDLRVEIREGDFRDAGVLIPSERFDLITSSPPYFGLTTGVHSSHPQKQACRFEMRGSILDYCQVAANHLEPEGSLFSVFPIQPEFQLKKLQEAGRNSGLSVRRMRPVCLKEGTEPMLAVIEFAKQPDSTQEKVQSILEPALIIRRKNGEVHPEYEEAKALIGFSVGSN